MKLDPTRKHGILIGYSELEKAYLIYIPDHRKMEVRRGVTFEEDVAYWRSRHTDSDSDDSQYLLASSSSPGKNETMEDDSIETTDPIDPIFID